MANVIISTSRENRGLSFQLSVLTNFVIKPNYPGFNFVVKPNCPGFSLIVIIINQKEERRGERERKIKMYHFLEEEKLIAYTNSNIERAWCSWKVQLVVSCHGGMGARPGQMGL